MLWSLLWRLYAIVLLFSGALTSAIRNYRSLNRHLRWAWLQWIFTSVVLPRVSEWHVLLSDMLLPTEDVYLDVDVLTKSGTLYQGPVSDRMIGADGSLQSLTLTDPRRFQLEEYKAAKNNGQTANRDEYWRKIPGKLFVILGSDIVNVNVRYPPRTPAAAALTKESLTPGDVDRLKLLLQRLRDQQKQP